MKSTRNLAVALAASAVVFAACDKKPADTKSAESKSAETKSAEPTPAETKPAETKPAAAAPAAGDSAALEAFKAAAKEIEALIKEGKGGSNPAEGMPKIRAAYAKMMEIKTEGLPADLAETFTASRTGTGELLEMFKDMPEKPEEALAWMQKTFSDPVIGEKMQKLGEANQSVSQKFRETAAKYGIEISTE